MLFIIKAKTEKQKHKLLKILNSSILNSGNEKTDIYFDVKNKMININNVINFDTFLTYFENDILTFNNSTAIFVLEFIQDCLEKTFIKNKNDLFTLSIDEDFEQYYEIIGDNDNVILSLVLESELKQTMKIVLRTYNEAESRKMVENINGFDIYATTALL